MVGEVTGRQSFYEEKDKVKEKRSRKNPRACCGWFRDTIE